jgi:hypothetical protein
MQDKVVIEIADQRRHEHRGKYAQARVLFEVPGERWQEKEVQNCAQSEQERNFRSDYHE